MEDQISENIQELTLVMEAVKNLGVLGAVMFGAYLLVNLLTTITKLVGAYMIIKAVVYIIARIAGALQCVDNDPEKSKERLRQLRKDI